MWQVDNDRYALWRLEHEMLPTKIERLIDSAIVADREPAPNALQLARRLATTIRLRLASALHLQLSRAADNAIIVRAPRRPS